MAFAIKINGNTHSVDVDGDTPASASSRRPNRARHRQRDLCRNRQALAQDAGRQQRFETASVRRWRANEVIEYAAMSAFGT
jgi:hypothetical protein